MRILHTMIRVGDLDRSLAFYTNVLGMRLLRRNDYPEGRFTLAFVGYGEESDNAVIELTHNWDTTSYEMGNAFGHLALGVPDAYELPPGPGNGYLKYDPTTMVRFKAAYVSGPWHSTATTGWVSTSDLSLSLPQRSWTPPVLEFTADFVPPVEPPPEAETPEVELTPTETVAADDGEDETLLSLVVERLRGQG